MSASAFHVKVYPPSDEPIEFTSSKLSFVNDESYGPADNFGIKPDGDDVTLVNLANALIVEVTPEND